MIQLLLIGLMSVVFAALFISGFISVKLPKHCRKCVGGEMYYVGSSIFWTRHRCSDCGRIKKAWRGFWKAR